jgi:competence CoiA-like predicted nuclease
MPFVASDINGDRVDITKHPQPKTTIKRGSIFCPSCGKDFIIREGSMKRSHFAHKVADDWCPYSVYERGQSAEHREAKIYISENLKHYWPEYASSECLLEYFIKTPNSRKNRIADLLFKFSSGWDVVHEIQLSPQSEEVLKQRTEDYLLMGMDVVWWFGGKALQQEHNIRWSQETYGGLFKVEFSRTGGIHESRLPIGSWSRR